VIIIINCIFVMYSIATAMTTSQIFTAAHAAAKVADQLVAYRVRFVAALKAAWKSVKQLITMETVAYTITTPASLTLLHLRRMDGSRLLVAYVTRNGRTIHEVNATTTADVAAAVAELNAIEGITLGKTESKQWVEQLAGLGYMGAYALYPTFEGLQFPNVAVFAARPDLANINPFKPNRESAEWAAYCAINNK